MADTSPHSDGLSTTNCTICGCSLKGISEVNGRCSPCFWNRSRENKDIANRCGVPLCPFDRQDNSVFCTDHRILLGDTPIETKALKFDGDKLPLDLLPFEALEEIALVLKHGAKKYEAHNWRKGFVYSRPFAAILRHLFAYWKGEDIDQDSGLHHLAHAGCELLFLLSFIKTKTGVDDRYKKESSNNA